MPPAEAVDYQSVRFLRAGSGASFSGHRGFGAQARVGDPIYYTYFPREGAGWDSVVGIGRLGGFLGKMGPRGRITETGSP